MLSSLHSKNTQLLALETFTAWPKRRTLCLSGRDPRFAMKVGNVVVEFGDASQQAIIDRFVNGEEIPYSQLRKVWADTVGWFPTVTSMGYLNFYAQLRAVNRTLPKQERIRVWLGDPPLDWSKPVSQADLPRVLLTGIDIRPTSWSRRSLRRARRPW